MLIVLFACTEPPPPPAELPHHTVVPAPAAEPTPPPVAPPPAPPPVRAPPEGLVDLRVRVPSLQFDIRYATADNFTGEPLPGYGSPGAWATAAMADALAEVQAQVEADGGSHIVYDAYRPVRGTEAMVTWTKTTGQEHLITDGYIAARSGHNKGNTVDLTVSYDSHIVDMGTPWDTFSTDSHTRNATGDVLKRRLSLQKRMVDAGFRPYSKEWWHFSFPQKGLKAFDVPYGCSEEPACD